MTLRLLHTADWHLGLTFRRFGESDRGKLSRARLSTVERIFHEARALPYHAILCAGDLFDVPRPPTEVWQALLNVLNKARVDCPVILLPGNHDYIGPDTVWGEDSPFRRGLPDNFQVVTERNQEFEIGDNAVVIASACDSEAGADDHAANLPPRPANDERIRIGMVHGQTFEMKGHQNNFPVNVAAAGRNGYDYLALGDTHAFRTWDEEGVVATYPGTPEATRFGEKDYGHFAQVVFRKGRKADVTKQKVGTWAWRESTCETVSDLQQLQLDPDLKHTVLKLNLQMSVSVDELHQVQKILQQLETNDYSYGKVGILQADASGLRQADVSADEFPDDLPDILKATIRRLEEHDDPEIANRALAHLYNLVTRKEA